jgi:hypothetical protein
MMSDWISLILELLNMFVLSIGFYFMGRNDENKKWAHVWFEQWRTLTEMSERVKNLEEMKMPR